MKYTSSFNEARLVTNSLTVDYLKQIITLQKLNPNYTNAGLTNLQIRYFSFFLNRIAFGF
jgi:hypothetical protein